MKKVYVSAVIMMLAMITASQALACATCGCRAKAKPGKEQVTKAKDKHEHKTIGTKELRKLIKSDKKIVLLDARAGKWDDGRRIAHARQLAPNASKRGIRKAAPDKNARIVAYCTNKQCGASEVLARKLIHMGYKNVTKYPDGIEGWVAAGNKVVKK